MDRKGSGLRLTPPNPDISYANRSADLRVCCIAGFQTCGRCERFDALPIWKSAIQQFGNLRYKLVPSFRFPSVKYAG
jgi:hypothetical protein